MDKEDVAYIYMYIYTIYIYIYIYTHTPYIYIHTMEYYLAIKKNEILPFATMWMELEGIMLNEISQSDKDTNHTLHSYEDFKRQNR